MNYKIKAILLEDEINALELNERIIHQIEDIELLASYQSILEAEKNIIQLKPKLLFLDIKIRGRYVFEMLDRLKEQQLHFSIIFISAYIKEQLENIIDTVGFEKFPFGYIHKPLSLDKLTKQIHKFRLKHTTTLTKEKDALLLKESNKNSYIKVHFKNIIYFESEEKYVYIYYFQLNTVRKIIISDSLKNLERSLPKRQFFRMSNKHIINKDFLVRTFKENNNWVCELNLFHLNVKHAIQLPIPEKKWSWFKKEFGL